jgi:very-short-patch-repair endonuclease
MDTIIPQSLIQNSHKPKGRPKGIPAHNKKTHPEITCETCGKAFTVKPYRKDLAKYCSHTCSSARNAGNKEMKPKRERHPQVEQTCQNCGITFMAKFSKITQGRGKFCSHHCAGVATGKRIAQERTRKMEQTCRWCKASFWVKRNQVLKGSGIYCSRRCRSSYVASILATQQGPTSIEIAVEQVLKTLNEPYEAQKQIGPWLVDFYLPAYRLVIECDGKYWHSLPNAIRRDAAKNHWMPQHEYNIVRLGEDAIRANATQIVIDALAQYTKKINIPQQLQLPLDL